MYRLLSKTSEIQYKQLFLINFQNTPKCVKTLFQAIFLDWSVQKTR